MRSKASSYSIQEKIVVLSFDEMSLSAVAAIDRKREQKIGPNKHCQVLTARGLFGAWKQPVFYDFDTAMTSDLLLNIISHYMIVDIFL